jgi:hypothetical protein
MANATGVDLAFRDFVSTIVVVRDSEQRVSECVQIRSEAEDRYRSSY